MSPQFAAISDQRFSEERTSCSVAVNAAGFRASGCYIEPRQSVGRSRVSIPDTYSRKVRAPLDGPPGNSWAQVARAAYVTDSATENRPPPLEGARVKRWGKSPPRSWQHERHGKPRSEQGQICGERCPPRSRHRG